MRFEPGTSRTTGNRATTRPLPPASDGDGDDIVDGCLGLHQVLCFHVLSSFSISQVFVGKDRL